MKSETISPLGQVDPDPIDQLTKYKMTKFKQDAATLKERVRCIKWIDFLAKNVGRRLNNIEDVDAGWNKGARHTLKKELCDLNTLRSNILARH